MTNPAPLSSTPRWTVTPDVKLQVNSVAFSADGACCVFGTSNEFSTGAFAVYCTDGDGNARWSKPVGDTNSTQGVFWVAASADGQFAAAGGETSKTAGFLCAYRVADGAQVLNVTAPYRFNQVVLSGDGSLLLAVTDDTVQLYSYANGAYSLASQLSFPGSDCNSCALSPDGFKAVVSCTFYSKNKPTTGQVVSLDVNNAQLVAAGTWASRVGVMRVAITATGNYWGASLHDGSCVLFSPSYVTQPVWQYQPDEQRLSVAYGFDITETQAGRVVLACGTNLFAPALPDPAAPGGYLYLVESVQSGNTQVPQFCWGSTLAYSANPGISLDREARNVTATDGKPSDERPGHVSETPGHFYLFDAVSGSQLWSYATPVMNWPMVITPDGSQVFGGSDDGSVYFWGRPAV